MRKLRSALALEVVPTRVGLGLVASLALALAPSGLMAQSALPLKHTPQPTTAAITPGDLMTRLYIFADDSMQGREMGALGNVKGTDYIAASLERMGVEPAGENGTYFQTVPYKTRTLDTLSSVSVAGTSLRLGEDYLPVSRESATLDGVGIVYGGEIGEQKLPLTPAQARGKLVVLTVNPRAGIRGLRRAPDVEGAAGLAIVALDQIPQNFRRYFTRPQGFVDDPEAPGPERQAGSRPNLLISSDVAARMFSSPLDQLQPGAEGKTASIHLRYDVTSMPYPSRNVVAVVRGSDPQLAHEYVAIGAHSDHLGFSHNPVAEDSIRIFNQIVRPEGADDSRNQPTPTQQKEVDSLLAVYRAAHPGSARQDSVYNGADDDGSGSVAVLEIAEKIASLRPAPKRSVLFVWHVGEEKGLLGSRYFTDHPTVPRDSIVAQLNMDMVGRGDASDETGHTKDGQAVHGGPNYLMLVGSRRLSTELGDLVEAVNTEDHHGLRFDYAFDADGHPANIYCRSDHYEYARYGIPIVFFTTGLHRDYHQVSDEPEYVDYTHMAKVVNFVEDVAVHVADLDHRVVVDHPKPDPYGACRQ